jgi:hypothetical protein
VDTEERAGLQDLAEECVLLVAEQYGLRLDWTADSLAVLDAACARLLADGPLSGRRLDLWWKLIGAYTGEVLVRAFDGTWISHEKASGAYAVSVLGLTAFPFATVDRILRGEPYKSLASFVRALPAIVERSGRPPTD